MNIVVRIPQSDTPRRYALEQILEQILGLNVSFQHHDLHRSEIECGGVSLIFPFVDSQDIQVGDELVNIYGSDIPMSAFFMLSRIEEVNADNSKLDIHGRFKASSSLAFQHGFLDRPVVNEYAEYIVRYFESQGVSLPVHRQGARIIFTHDVDILTNEPILKSMIGDIIKRHDILSAVKRIRNLWYDEHDTFDSLMSMSEERNQKGVFNIMATHYDYKKSVSKHYLNNRAFASMLHRLTSRGHILGFHPGYHTSDNEEEWKRERSLVEQRVQQILTVGRQHYLRVFIPRTLEIWEDNGMTLDSSLGYADKTGFRCGTGCVYHPYDFRTGKAMRLLEQPLILMDATVDSYENLSASQKEERIMMYDSLSHKYDMPITLLYHN